MIIDVYIGNEKLEMFKDETIELNSSIANTSDITKNTTEYTKSFTVPASEINNRIFKHYYNANVDNTFDARVKVDGRIELGGVPFKSGKWRLEKVSLSKGVPKDYTINFRGNLINLKDKFKDDTLNDLDLSARDHLYNDTNVKEGLSNSLFGGDIVYNLFSKKQLFYNSNPSENTNTTILANIAFGGGSATGVKWNELKPSLRVSKIVEAIANKYGLTFSNDFFGREEFTKLYVWLNRELSIQGMPTEQLLEWVYVTPQDAQGLNFTTNKWINTQSNNRLFQYRVTVNPSDNSIPYSVIVKNFGVPVAQFNSEGGQLVTEFTLVPFDGSSTPFEYTFHLSSSNSFTYKATLFLKSRYFPFAFNVTFNFPSYTTVLVDSFNISANLPEIKVIDFMKALFSMFKLVVIADSEDNIYINTIKDYYASGIVVDLTKYIYFEKYDVERGNILNTINFKFEDPTTLLNDQFKLNEGLGYGDEELILQDENGELLDGDQLDVKLPFEQIVYERLKDVNDGVSTNVMYAGVFNKNIEAVNPKMHLYYNIRQNIIVKPIAFRNAANVKQPISFLNTPSHTIRFDNPQYSTIFSEEFNEWNGLLITNTLYSNYYKDYVESIFNIKKRNFKFTAKNIPIRILTNLQLKDIIQIKNDFYRIDNYNFNILTGETTLNLINSFDNTVLPFNADRLVIFADFTAQTQNVYVTNLTAFDFISSEIWVSCTNEGNIVYFDIEENLTGFNRSAIVTIINTDTLREIEITVIQSAGVVSFDNEVINFDNDIITLDNG